ncbi:MAG TPA: hypothetical protein VKQ29_09970 [Aliidongia sp.]|nr:hypothetical protein [Aliidongia sp.]
MSAMQHVGLLERLAAEKLARAAETVKAEGWSWVEVAIDFPEDHTDGFGVIACWHRPLGDEETMIVATLTAERDRIEQIYGGSGTRRLDIEWRLREIEIALVEIEQRRTVYNMADLAKAGAFVSIDASGRLRVERGFVRLEDEAPVAKPARLCAAYRSAAGTVGGNPVPAARACA